MVELFCTELQPGERYDLASIVVPIRTEPGLPSVALRAAALPPGLTTEQIEEWIGKLERVAAEAAMAMTGARR